ncbi:MAG: dynein regulation protein LC7 [Euryarchaeota archaeon]|nr:dynein regulation protein LC7 [Euryarchaeota archaeon]
MVETVREMIEEFKSKTGVDKVVLVSRTGMYMEGDDIENQDTFSAMSAIVLGAAETATSALGTVERICVEIEKGVLLTITAAGRRGVLAVISKEDHWNEIVELKEKLKGVI